MKRLLLFFLLSAALLASSGSNVSASDKDASPKYVFLFIGDGMGMTHVCATESYLAYKDGCGSRLTMSGFPYFGFCTTFSADADVTDSSAAGTAIACGEKTNNGYVGVDPEGKPLESMAYVFKDRGYQIALLSNVPVNHATPASFYARNRSRSDYYDIASQISQTGFDFFAGSGILDVRGRKKDKEPMDEYLTDKGYPVCYGVEEFDAKADAADRIVFCQASSREDGTGNYVSDGKKVKDITLAEMLQLGLDFVDTDEPFFFMCEGGNIDWDSHANKLMPMVADVMEFDKAISVAFEFYKEHPDETLIVVTADHETGGLTLGSRRHHIDWATLEGQWEQSGFRNVLSEEDNAALNDRCSVSWSTGGHTGTYVPVFSVGVNAERFSGRMDNTELKSKIINP